MLQGKSLKKRIDEGETVYGTFFKLNDANLVEMLGLNGFDFIIIDTEHSNYTRADVENLVRAADYANISAIVRVAANTEEHILHAMDSGACGIQVPGLETVEAAVEAAKAAKYFPLGNRGLSTAQRAAKFGNWDGEVPYIQFSNENSLVVAHIENLEMASHVEELCEISLIDVLFVGPADLSQSMGMPGKSADPKVQAVISGIFQRAAAKGKAVGIFAGTPELVERYRDMGAKYIVYASDAVLINRAFKAAAGRINELKTR